MKISRLFRSTLSNPVVLCVEKRRKREGGRKIEKLFSGKKGKSEARYIRGRGCRDTKRVREEGLHTQRRRKAGGESRFTFLLHALLFSPGERTIDRPPRTRPFAVAVSWTGFLCRISPQGIRKNARGCYSPSPSLAAERERERGTRVDPQGRTRRCNFNLENN